MIEFGGKQSLQEAILKYLLMSVTVKGHYPNTCIVFQ